MTTGKTCCVSQSVWKEFGVYFYLRLPSGWILKTQPVAKGPVPFPGKSFKFINPYGRFPSQWV